MERVKKQICNGFSLIELLIVVAIIGILAAAGTIGYQNYIVDARSIDAQNGLRAIYLMQRDFFLDNNAYWPNPAARSDGAAAINTGLFSGDTILDPASTYAYTVTTTTATTFTATATDAALGCTHTIDNTNTLTSTAGCP